MQPPVQPTDPPAPLRLPPGRAPAVAALLTTVALAMRASTLVDGPVDIDTLNFGLAAFRFDLTDHQPHPPGYPGYVLYLKLLHALLGRLDPVALATWGSLLAGVACVPAAWWASRSVSALQGDDEPQRDLVGIASAMLAATHAQLWYSSCDGQAHAAEALAAFLSVGGAAWARAVPSTARAVILATLVALSASLRPTVLLVSLPFVLWALWNRPRRTQALAAGAFALATLAWYAPLVWASGGWDLYTRTTQALVGDIFVANYSIVNLVRAPWRVVLNASVTLFSLLFAAIPAIAWRPGPWLLRTPWRVALAVPVLFYAAVYTAESGYLSGLGALFCLAPLTWRADGAARYRGRALLAALVGIAVFLLAPEFITVGSRHAQLFLPARAHMVETDRLHHAFERHVCVPARGTTVFLITDNANTNSIRAVPVQCPEVVGGWYMLHPVVKPSLDHWQVFYADGMDTLPTAIPYEMGPPARGTLRHPVRWVAVSPDATVPFHLAVRSMATCAPVPVAGSDAEFYPARCIPELRFGQNVLRVPTE